MQQSITSPYFLKLLPICTGGRSHFSLNLRASLVPAYYRDKFSFCTKKRIGLCFTDGNMWPSKISNGPPKNRKGAKHGPQNYWPGDNTEPSRKDVLPSKIWNLYKKMGPPILMMGPHHIQSWVPRTPKHSTWCKTLTREEKSGSKWLGFRLGVRLSLRMQWFYLAIFEAVYGSHSQSKNGLYFPNFMYFSSYLPNFNKIFSQMCRKR